MGDYLVTVCDRCLCASCWQGIFMCDASQNAGTVELRVSVLRKIDQENPYYFSKEQIAKVEGNEPVEIR